jgi:hypothetical protein
MIDEFVVEAGRASCCSWEYNAYRLRSKLEPVQASDFAYRVLVGLSVASDTDDEVTCTCTFTDSDNQIVLPDNSSLLPLCGLYGPDYMLATPDSVAL